MSAAQEVVTSKEVSKAKPARLVERFADRYGIEPNRMMATLRATVIRPDKNGTEATNEQIASFLVVANQHDLNPFTKEIHAFLGRQGSIVCVVGLDGWAKKVNEHPQFDGMEFEQDDEKCTCKMYRKDRSHPVIVTEYHKECFRPTEPWQSHPKRMLRHKALIQCARIAFSFAGIYDPDEAEAIIANEEIDITPRDEFAADTDKGPAKISAVRMRKIVEAFEAAIKADDAVAYQSQRTELSDAEWLLVWKHLRSWERTALNKLDDKAKALPPKDLVGWSLTAIDTAKDAEALQASWRAIQDAFAESDQEVPADVETIYVDRKQVLAP